MKKLLAVLLILTTFSASAQFGIDGIRTNASWLNANQLVVGYTPLGRYGTNTWFDGATLVVTGNRLQWVSASSATSLSAGGILYDTIYFVNVAYSITNSLSYDSVANQWLFKGAWKASGFTSTNGYTNFAAVASTIALWDANKNISSLANASAGVLTNASGVFGWWNPSFLYNPGNALGAYTNNGSGVFGYYNNYASKDAANVFTASNTFSGLHIVNGETNDAWTANTLLEANGNKASTSIANAGGILTQDGSGNFAWVATNAITNITLVSSTTIPMGAWSTNNVGDGASLTPASFEQPTNSGDAMAFAHTNGTSAVTNRIISKWALPWDWDGGAVRVSLEAMCSGTNASAGGPTNSVWAVQAGAVGNGDRLDSVSYGTAIWVTNGISTNKFIPHTVITTDLTVGNSPDPTKSIVWDIRRLSGQAGDTLTNFSLYLTEVRIYYKRETRQNWPTPSP